jgi:hypothetical protein
VGPQKANRFYLTEEKHRILGNKRVETDSKLIPRRRIISRGKEADS